MQKPKTHRELITPNIRAVFYDWDDTIVETMAAKIEQHRSVAMNHYGIQLLPEEMLADWGRPLHELIAKWYNINGADVTKMQEVCDTVFSYSNQFPKKSVPGALGALVAMKNTGLKVGVVTGSPRHDVVNDFSNVGTEPSFFDYFQYAEDSSSHKPSPAVFDPLIAYLENEGITPEEALYVGDTPNDYLAAVGADMAFIGVHTGPFKRGDFAQLGATSIASVADLLPQS